MLVEPRRNQISSWTIAPKATFLVVTSGKPCAEVEPDLPAEDAEGVDLLARRAEHGPGRLPHAVGANVAEQVEVLPHAELCSDGARGERCRRCRGLYAGRGPISWRPRRRARDWLRDRAPGRDRLRRGRSGRCGGRSGRDRDQLLLVLLLEHAVVPGPRAEADQEGPLAGDEPLALDPPAVDLGDLDRGGDGGGLGRVGRVQPGQVPERGPGHVRVGRGFGLTPSVYFAVWIATSRFSSMTIRAKRA